MKHNIVFFPLKVNKNFSPAGCKTYPANDQDDRSIAALGKFADPGWFRLKIIIACFQKIMYLGEEIQ
jgi:hypothetical protein